MESGSDVSKIMASDEYQAASEAEKEIGSAVVCERQLKTFSNGIKISAKLGGDISDSVESAISSVGDPTELIPLFFLSTKRSPSYHFFSDQKLYQTVLSAFNESLVKRSISSNKAVKNYFAEIPEYATIPIENEFSELCQHNISDVKSSEKPFVEESNSSKKSTQRKKVLKTLSLATPEGFTKILSPKLAYFNDPFKLVWQVHAGRILSVGDKIANLKSETENISIEATKLCQLTRFLVEDGALIAKSGVELCEVSEFNSDGKEPYGVYETYETRSVSEATTTDTGLNETNIEVKLEKLKNLYAKKLISTSVFEQKQFEILKEL